MEVLVTQLYPTLCDPKDYCSLPGSSVHGIFQAILEWVSSSFSKGSSQTRDRIPVFRSADRFFTIWATSPELVDSPKWILFSDIDLTFLDL